MPQICGKSGVEFPIGFPTWPDGKFPIVERQLEIGTIERIVGFVVN
jgi:hypothetical protein